MNAVAEMRLLIECARAKPDAAALRQAASDVDDWPSLLDRAARHGLTAQLGWQLGASAADQVPLEISRALRAHVVASTRCVLFYSAELARVARLFETARVSMLSFKGPTLAWLLYEEPGTRQMSDIDVLVPHAQIERAIDVLLADGYEPACVTLNRQFFRWNQEVPLYSRKRGTTIDLHWALAPSHFDYALDVDQILSRSVRMEIAGHGVTTLGNHDLLIFLCVHGAKHGWNSLHWLADVARLLDRTTVDWDTLLADAQTRRVSRIIHLGLLLCQNVLGSQIPTEAFSRLDAQTRLLTDETANRFRTGLPCEAQAEASFSYQLAIIERKRDRLRFCLGHLTPTPADLADLSIPPPCSPPITSPAPRALLGSTAAAPCAGASLTWVCNVHLGSDALCAATPPMAPATAKLV